jgi:RNA polymerase primary sigma factor
VPTPSDIAHYRDELKALAENIPFRKVELAEIEDPKYKVECVRQERTYVRIDSNMQAIGRFLVERGTVEILKPEMTLALFREIHHCAYRLRRLAEKPYRTTRTAHTAVMEGRRLISEMEAAEEELFIANRRLVVRCVKPFVWIGQVWLSDFLQEGSKALSNAIRKFDFTRGTPFYAYAQKAIQNRLRNYFRDHVRAGSIGIRPSRDMVRIKNVAEAWVKIHGKEPDADALASMTGLTRARVNQLRAFQRQYEKVPAPPVSLDAMLGDSTASLHDLVEDDDAAVASDRAQVAEIWAAMDQLPERSRRIMKLRFIEGRTLEETGNMLSLTRARIKQIQDDSVRKLREILREGIHKRE